MTDAVKPLVTLSKHDLQVHKFASTDDSRPLLTAVMLRKNDGNYELVATNSYIAIVHKLKEFEESEFKPILIPAATLKKAGTIMGRSAMIDGVLNVVEVYKDYIRLPALRMSIEFTAIEGKYPDLDKLIREINHKEFAKPVVLNPEYVNTVMSFFQSQDYNVSVEVSVNDKLAPVEFKTTQSYALVMPLKS